MSRRGDEEEEKREEVLKEGQEKETYSWRRGVRGGGEKLR